MKTPELIALASLIVGGGGFTFGLFQYWRAQRWKVAEFVAKEFKEFENNPAVSDALILIDWYVYQMKFSVLGEESPEYRVVQKDLIDALKKHEDVPDGFSDKLSAIRMTFDVLFGKLGTFYHYIQTGLIKRKDIDPYLIYWIRELTGEGKILKKDTCLQVWIFLDHYNYDDVISLFNLYGCDIRGSIADTDK